MLSHTENQPHQASKFVPSRPLNVLLVCFYSAGTAGTVLAHIESLKANSKHNVFVLLAIGDFPKRLDLARFDAIIIHYSILACDNSHIGPTMRSQLRSFKGLKCAFVQDDYRHINRTVDAMRDIGVHVLFGLASADIIDQVYSPNNLPGVRRETVLAGYVPEGLAEVEVPAYGDRLVDIGYRARKVPPWLGSHSQEKWQIAEKIMAGAPQYGLLCDISTSENDRIYNDKWIKFITGCKAFIGTESGSSVCDFTGEIQKNVEAHLAVEPNTPFERLRELYFKNEDGKIVMNVISPRCFEAAALRTLMVLYEGDYSGRLQAWRHYVVLKRDHSNMDEVAAIILDEKRATEIIERAYREVALNPENSFKAMVQQVDRAIDATIQSRMLGTSTHHFSLKLHFLMVSFLISAIRVMKNLIWFSIKTFSTKSQRQFVLRMYRRAVKGFELNV